MINANNIPRDEDFQIRIEGLDPIGKNPPIQEEVIAKEFFSYVLDNEGVSYKKVNIRIW